MPVVHPSADHAADAIVIYDLARPGAFELADGDARRRRAEAFELLPLEDLAGENRQTARSEERP